MTIKKQSEEIEQLQENLSSVNLVSGLFPGFFDAGGGGVYPTVVLWGHRGQPSVVILNMVASVQSLGVVFSSHCLSSQHKSFSLEKWAEFVN